MDGYEVFWFLGIDYVFIVIEVKVVERIKK